MFVNSIHRHKEKSVWKLITSKVFGTSLTYAMLVYVNWLAGFLVMFKFQFLKRHIFQLFSRLLRLLQLLYCRITLSTNYDLSLFPFLFLSFPSLSPLSHTLSLTLSLSPTLLGLLSWGYLQSSFVCEMALASFLFLQLRRNKVKHEITWSW